VEQKGKEEEGSGDSEQDAVGSARVLAAPIRLRSNYGRSFFHMISVSSVWLDL